MTPPPPYPVFLRTRDNAEESYPDIPLVGGIPLFNLAHAPCRPLDFGTRINGMLLGPRKPTLPEYPDYIPPHTTTDIGLEGTVIAARRMDEDHAEIVVRNESWGRTRYAAVRMKYTRNISMDQVLWDALRYTGEGHDDGDERREKIKCYPCPARGENAAEIARHPPVIHETIVDLKKVEEGWWTCKEELDVIEALLGRKYQSMPKGWSGRESKKRKEREEETRREEEEREKKNAERRKRRRA